MATARRKIVLLASVAGVVLAVDVATKVWAVERLSTGPIAVFGTPVRLQLAFNRGAAFGIGQGATVVFSLIAVVVIAAITRTARRLGSAAWALSLGLVLGGATGNLVDRMLRAPGPFRGRVVDFVDLRVWPIFNVADAAIVSGGLLAVLLTWRGVEMEGETEADHATEPAGTPAAAGDTEV